MNILIDGIERTFTPIKAFRAAHDLPPAFAVRHFEPKDYVGLGSLERAGDALTTLRAAVLNAAPAGQPVLAWLANAPALTDRFRAELLAINPRVGLREVEIDFAAAGFGDVLTAFLYARLRDPAADFQAVYAAWLHDSIRISQTEHAYDGWRVRVITHAYGRFGLECVRAGDTHYVYDAALACPAQGFMESLLAAVCEKLPSIS